MDQTRLVTLDNGYHLFTRKVNEGPIKLLCLHGGPGGTHETFDNFKDGLKGQGVEVYSYDQLGSYYSDQPDFTKKENKSLLSIPRYVDEVEEVRQKLGLDNFYLLGHSWGGLLAQEYAYKYGKHLKGLVLMSMIDNLDEYTENINHEREETFSPEQVDYMKECEKAENFTDPMYQQLVAHLYSLFLTRHPTGTTHPVNTHNNVIYNYFQGNNEFVMVGELTKWDFREKLASLKMPTLLTFGEFDTMPLSAARRMHQTLSNSRLTLTPDGGHCHNTDNPKAFFTSLTKFLHDVENNTFKGE
jgi:proline iminopeptidase